MRKKGKTVSLETEMEIEANYFAFVLLMPEEYVRSEAKRLAPDGFDIVEDPAVKQMAQKFNVSMQMMTIRLVLLGYFDSLKE